MELITVIIPVYNSEQTVKRCLDSVISQSYPELEILIINDGSSDRTLEICEAYAEEDSRINIFSQENRGVSAARNLGIKNASGKYMAFVDADDYIEKKAMQCLYQLFQSGAEVDWAICNYDMIIDGEGKNSGVQCEPELGREQAICSLFDPRSVKGYLCTKMFRADIIKKYEIWLDETIHMTEDLLFCCQYGLHIRKAYYVKQPMYHYVMNADGATWGRYTPKQFTAFYAFQKMRKLVKKLENIKVNKALEAAYVVTCIQLAKKVLKKYKSFRVKEMRELMGGIHSTGWSFLSSNWSWKYKAAYIPMKMISYLY